MAIRRSADEDLVVDGPRDQWLERCKAALDRAHFTRVEVSDRLWQIHANYKKMTVWGTLQITLTPQGKDEAQLHLVATANVDNVFALLRSPTKKILSAFKAELDSHRP